MPLHFASVIIVVDAWRICKVPSPPAHGQLQSASPASYGTEVDVLARNARDTPSPPYRCRGRYYPEEQVTLYAERVPRSETSAEEPYTCKNSGFSTNVSTLST